MKSKTDNLWILLFIYLDGLEREDPSREGSLSEGSMVSQDRVRLLTSVLLLERGLRFVLLNM